ncbi:MAG: multidrug ABC transporter ATP-binding protein [Candidatus Wallbacteria bacterium HGW-Wallbacteria-1]|uniref:Multidrug ABC transporter ATP-binding protein n=1 Tax=Candidatus Wallbacteria bacterium HGW-Wallbacteria-1 TaxID=2013854 RepID=A0A2N1PNW5_9BACT|nr:MAG: multidrug ABC transporter ATP-binding protein [Candidatus Wallbacteria bacterium HGW-Wallbacteria-1]
MVRIDNFRKVYDDRTVAVRDLSLTIDRGDIFGFIGPNGAGKTTTIKFLSTLLKPTSGSGWINGFSITRDPMGVRRSMGYMPDFYGVYNGMNVTEFLDFFASAYGIGVRQRRDTIDDLLSMLNLESKRFARVEDLSRGMKQRLCLARTLVHDPALLILDEPASGLDPRARVEMKKILKELQNLGKTIIISSHILSELADLCNKVMIIEKGNLIVSGPIDEITSRLRKHMIIRITVDDGPEKALEVLNGCEYVRKAEAYGSHIRVEFAGTEKEVAVLHADLSRSEVGLIWFYEEEIDLEQVFLSYTSGEVA